MSRPRSFLNNGMRKMQWNLKKLVWASATALAGVGLVLSAPAVQVPGASPVLPALRDASAGSAVAEGRPEIQMKRYKNQVWRFALDIPVRWNAFPPGPALSSDEVSGPSEVVRFLSSKAGDRSLAIVYRMPRNPAVDTAVTVKQLEATLSKSGFSNFVIGETKIGSRQVLTLDFEKLHPGGETWRARSYYIVDGTLMYVLGFGATDGDAIAGLYDQMATSFTFEDRAT